MRLVIGSFNIHGCVGTDGRRSPDRIGKVIDEMGADLLALQEVDSGYHVEGGIDQIEYLSRLTGMDSIAGPTLRHHAGHYGNALLTRRKVGEVRRIDLSVSGWEPRGALDVDMDIDGCPVQVIVTHLGLRLVERVQQVQQIMQRLITRPRRGITVIAGDFNEWRPGDRSLRPLHARFGRSRLRTFPSRWPIFAFDRILVEPQSAMAELRVHSSPLARVASDHLPVRAVVKLKHETEVVTWQSRTRG